MAQVVQVPAVLPEAEETDAIAGGEHGEIGSLLNRFLGNHVYPNKLGRVFDGQTQFRIGGITPKRQPDVAFVKLERMPQRIRGDIPFAPDLAVEIVSPTNSSDSVDEKIIQYQTAQVSLIWVIRPLLRLVEVFRLENGLVPEIVSGSSELDGGAVIPGFKLKVADIFED